jgi:probable rRNA maturation factor
VLSFSQFEGEEFPFELPADSLPLGDLVISIETAARQAAERHHSLATEIAFLAVHGTLHLLGYDHVTSAQRRAMWKQQEAIVELLQAVDTDAGRTR